MTTTTTQSEKRTPLKLPNNEEVISKLVKEIEDIFTKEELGNHPQLVFKMNESLEIPITALYKEKRISAITSNLVLIREALKSATKVVYDPKRETVRPDIKPLKNILIINHLDDGEKEQFLNFLTASTEYSRKLSENFFNSMGGYSLTLQNEADAESLCDSLKKQNFKSRQLEILVEQENLYLSILQRAQDIAKYAYQGYGYGYGYGQMDPNAYYQQYYYFASMYPGLYGYDPKGDPHKGKSHGKKGRGSANYTEDYEEGEEEKGQSHGDDYNPKRGAGKNQKKKGGAGKQHREYEKKSQNKHNETKELSPAKKEEIIKRTRINSENFPPLSKDSAPIGAEVVSKAEEKAKGLKHGSKLITLSKAEITAAFEKLQKAGAVKMNPALAGLNDELIPVLDKTAEPQLEVIQPKPVAKETRPKRRTLHEDQRSPVQGGAELSHAPQNQTGQQ